MSSTRRAGMALLATGAAMLLVAAAEAAPKLVAGQVCSGGGLSSGGQMVVGSIPSSAAGRSAGGSKLLIGGFLGCVYAVRESAAELDTAASATGALVSSLTALGSRGGGAQITFSLTAAAVVDVRVLNIAGRPVRTVAQAHACDAGLNTITWSGVSDLGLRVPRGVYLIELTSHADGGSRSKALTQVTVGN